MCVKFVYMNSGACGVQKKVSNSLEFEFWDLLNLGAENQTRTLCQRSKFFQLLSHLSRPYFIQQVFISVCEFLNMYIIVYTPVHMLEGQKRMASVLYLLFRVRISP